VNTIRGAVLAAALLALGACTPVCGLGAHFSLSNARVDSVYTCPDPSTDRPYDVHGSIDVDNFTASNVAIKSMAEQDVLVKTGGNWDGPKTAKASDAVTNYTPRSINAGDKATVRFSIGFLCSNTGAGGGTFGEFSFKFSLVTTNGTYTITAGNNHRLAFA
jgi:hypothetical protein